MDNSIVKASYNLSVSEQRLLLSALVQIPKNEPIDPKRAYYITREDFVRLELTQIRRQEILEMPPKI